MTARVLVVDDRPDRRAAVGDWLAAGGHEVQVVSDAAAAPEAVRRGGYRLLVAELLPAGLSATDLLAAVRSEGLPLGVLLLADPSDTRLAHDAIRAGADDVLPRPFGADDLRDAARRVLERRRLLDELERLRATMRRDYSFHNMVSKSPRMRRVFDLIEQVGPLGSTVLIQGETGTGKELVAQALHAAAGGRGPFVALNCAVLHDGLLESELFGHERGAFTGADRRRRGRFELADGGTLFLDEVGDVSPAMQAKLLRVLQTGTFERVGGTETLRVDVRVVAATNKRLDAEVKAQRFRADLFYRLSVIRIELPPLRDRAEDVPLLATHFLEKYGRTADPPVTGIEPEALAALEAYAWPGHVRELENAVKSAVTLADGPRVGREALPAAVAPRERRGSGPPVIDVDRPLPELTSDLVARVERDYFTRLLDRYRGNVARCARHSGLSRRSVTQKLRRYQLDRRRFRGAGATSPEPGPGG